MVQQRNQRISMNEKETALQRFQKQFNQLYPSKAMIVIPAIHVAKENNLTLLLYKTKEGMWYVTNTKAMNDDDNLMSVLDPDDGEIRLRM